MKNGGHVIRLAPVRATCLVFLLSATGPSANAETVKILAASSTGGQVSGQGWLVRDPASSRCLVVTAAHVVASSSAPAEVTVIKIENGRREEGVASRIAILSPTDPDGDQGGLDIALVDVGGSIAANGCTTSLLGYGTVWDFGVRPHSGTIRFVSNEVETITFPVSVEAENAVRPERITITVSDAQHNIEAGYSGTAVTTLERSELGDRLTEFPVALVTHVMERRASAVRFDVVAKLVRERLKADGAARRSLAPKALGFRIIRSSGVTVDPACGLSKIGGEAGCGWRVRPETGAASINIELETTAPTVSGVSLVYKGGVEGERGAIETSGQVSGDDWVWVRALPVTSGQMSARFQNIAPKRLKITLPAKTGQVAEISELKVY